MSRVVDSWRVRLGVVVAALSASCGRTSLTDFAPLDGAGGAGNAGASGAVAVSGAGFMPGGAGFGGTFGTSGTTSEAGRGGRGGATGGQGGNAPDPDCQLAPTDCYTPKEPECSAVRPACQGDLVGASVVAGTRTQFTAIATAPDGLVALAGYFQGTLSVDGQTRGEPATDEDGFLLVFDKQRKLLWSHFWGGIGAQAVTGVDFTPEGHVVVQGSHDRDANARAEDPHGMGFVEQLDQNGELLWSYPLGDGETYPGHVAIDNDGEITLVGGFKQSFAFRGLSKAGVGYASYVVHLDADGQGLWLDTTIPPGWKGAAAQKVVADDEDHVLVLGNGALATNMSVGYLQKLGPDGAPVYLEELAASEYVQAGALSVDGKMQVTIGGEFRGTTVLGAVQTASSRPFVNDLWLAKLNRDGSWLWAQTNEGEVDSTSRLSALTGDGLGNLVEARSSYNAIELRKRRDDGSLVWTHHFPTVAPTGLGLASNYLGTQMWLAGTFTKQLELGDEVLASPNDDSVFLLQIGR